MGAPQATGTERRSAGERWSPLVLPSEWMHASHPKVPGSKSGVGGPLRIPPVPRRLPPADPHEAARFLPVQDGAGALQEPQTRCVPASTRPVAGLRTTARSCMTCPHTAEVAHRSSSRCAAREPRHARSPPPFTSVLAGSPRGHPVLAARPQRAPGRHHPSGGWHPESPGPRPVAATPARCPAGTERNRRGGVGRTAGSLPIFDPPPLNRASHSSEQAPSHRRRARFRCSARSNRSRNR